MFFGYIDLNSIISYAMYLVQVIFVLIMTYILKILLLEVSHYFAVKKFKNIKGVATYYHFFEGISSLFKVWDGKDRLKAIAEQIAKTDDHMIVSNMQGCDWGTTYICLNTHVAIKDFFQQEINCTDKKLVNDVFPINFGFGTEGGQKGLDNRAIFHEFFLYDRIKTLYEPMDAIINIKIKEFIKEKNITKNEFTKVDVRDFFDKIMADWISFVLFGNESTEELIVDLTKYPEIINTTLLKRCSLNNKKVNLLEMISVYSDTCVQFFFDAFLILFDGWPYYFGLKEIYREHKIFWEVISKEIILIYEKRYAEYVKTGAKFKYTNLIDVLIEHNYNCIKNNNHKDIKSHSFIAGVITGIGFAGYDTSMQTSTSCVMWMVKQHPDWIAKIRNEGVDSLEKIKTNNSLDLVIKETLRLYNPTVQSFTRKVIKDMKITGVNIPKGTMIFVSTGSNCQKSAFIDSRKFRPERHETEVPSLKTYEFVPFMEGKRKCLGYRFAFMMMRLMIGYTMSKFEMQIDDDFDIVMELWLYKVKDATINLKLRN